MSDDEQRLREISERLSDPTSITPLPVNEARWLLRRMEELQEELTKIAYAVAQAPTVTGLQEGCVKDHSLIHLAILDAQETFKDTVARAKREAEAAERSLVEMRRSLHNLLAIIHRDGGHKTDEIGEAASVELSHKVWAEMCRELEEYRQKERTEGLLRSQIAEMRKGLEKALLILLQQKKPYSDADNEAMDVIEAILNPAEGSGSK